MNLDREKEKLRRYLLKRDSLKRKCQEVSVWESMSECKGGSVREASKRPAGPDAIKETAITLRQECEELAGEVAELRRELGDALSRLPDDGQRDILEKKYIEGIGNAQLALDYGCCVRQVRRRITLATLALKESGNFFC